MWRTSCVLSITAFALIALEDVQTAETSGIAETLEVTVTGEASGPFTSV
jgi:hypothetical protein